MNQENLFKHEALAGGKTTVLRNIITKIKADGINLSGVITHDTLIETHHNLFKNTTTNAYGDKAIRFEFCRKDPSDALALKALLRNLLKTIANHGRIDMTKKDALSFHHSYLMKFEDLLKGQRVDEIHQEITLMGEIFLLLREHCQIGSDEMDKVCDPEKEHNYATGEKGTIDRVKRDTAFEIVKWIFADDKFREIFSSNRQYRLMEDGTNELRRWIAGKIHDKYLPETDLEATIHYLTGLGEGESDVFFQKNIADSPDKSSLKAFQKYLSEVISGTLQHRNGVTFGRSKDLFLVKPFEGNGECAENSEHGTEEEIILYTCMNYIDQTLGGVLPEQVGQLVIEEQNKAAKSVLQSQKFNPLNPINYDSTPQSIRFLKEFNLNLRQVTPSDYPKIAKSINEDSQKLVEFLESRVFSQMSIRKEKIVGNSSDLVNLFKEFYGSSGTSNICQALLSKIVKDPALIKQPGVDGAVVLALIKDYKQGDMIELKEGQDLADQILAQLGSKNGSALIDLAPAFPGKLAKEIVVELSNKMQDKTNQFCFDDRDNSVKLYDATSKIAVKAKDNPNLDSATTIFDKGHTRGTDLLLSNHSIGYVTISADTKFSDFLQAVMRMRKLGKGQKVRYLIDAGVKKRLNNQQTLGNLFAMMVDNQSKGLKKLLLKSERQGIKSISKSAIFFQLPSVPETDREKVWNDVRKFFVHDTQESLDEIGQPKQLEESSIVLKDLADRELTNLKAVTTLANLENAHQELAKKASGETLINEIYLPSHTFKSNFDQEMQQEVEKEQEQEHEMTLEQEQEQEQVLNSANDEGIRWAKFQVNSIADLVEQLKNSNENRTFHQLNGPDSVPFYDDNIYYTENFSHASKSMKIWGSESASEKLHPKQMRHSRFGIIVEKSTGEVHSILGTPKDFDHVFEKLNLKKDPEFDFYIYNLNRDDLDGKTENWENYPTEIQEKIVRSIVQVKLLNGEIDLLKPDSDSHAPVFRREYHAFKNFLMEKIDVGLIDAKVLQANLRKYLALLRPTHALEYASSTMAKAFNECVPEL